MSITTCPGCGRPVRRKKTRFSLEHVPELGDDPTNLSEIRRTLLICENPNCGNWIDRLVRLPPEPTVLQYLPQRQREPRPDRLSLPTGSQS